MAKEVKKKETKKETQKQQIIKLFMDNTLISTDDIVAGVGCSDKYAKEVMKNIWMEPEIQQSPPLGLVTGTNLLRTKNKVSIVGFAPSSMRDVRHVWDDPDMEVWGINQLYMPGAFPAIVEKATRWFQIHHRSSYDQTVDRDITHHEWMAKQDSFPIYMQKQEPDIPTSVPFPKEEILQHYRKYFTNTITWMIVLAHYEGFKECHLYGVDMAQDSEHAFERPSVEWACGLFDGCVNPNTGERYRHIVIPEKSDICKSAFLYPFDETAPLKTKLQSRREELRGRLNHHSAEEQNNRDARMQCIGALDNQNHIEKSWLWNASRIEAPSTDIDLNKPQEGKK